MSPDYGRGPADDQRRRDQALRKIAQEEREAALTRKAREQAGSMAVPPREASGTVAPEPNPAPSAVRASAGSLAAAPTGSVAAAAPASRSTSVSSVSAGSPSGAAVEVVRHKVDAYRPTTGDAVVPAYPSRFDLHTHSRRSDGVMEPADLVRAAAAAGVRVLALTDHDTIAGVRELTAPGAAVLPLELIPGVEINTIARNLNLPEGELHILGLGLDMTDEGFEVTLQQQRESRETRFHRIVDRLRMLGYPIDRQVDEFLAGSGGAEGASLGRPQIARCLVAAGFAPTVDDAMQRLLLRGRPAYVPREGLGPREAISAIRAAGGLPSLAHFSEAEQRLDVVRELASLGLGGIEVYYGHFGMETVDRVRAVARELRLIPTGGSDYHGDTGSYAEAHAGLFIPDTAGMDVLSALGLNRASRSMEPARS